MTINLYSGTQCRELDRIAISEGGISGFDLMRRAGDAAFTRLLDRWPGLRSVSVCCGKGNNAGDGYLVAGAAKQLGIRVQLLQAGSAAALTGDAASARDWAQSQGVEVVEFATAMPALTGEVIVDALLGTGLSGAPREPFAAAIAMINDSGRPVLAIDIPSGVNADTGGIAGAAVKAAVTVTFIGRKFGLYTGPGRTAAGDVIFADLGVGAEVTDRIAGQRLLTLDAVLADFPLPVRSSSVYKQALGHVLVIGGDYAMGGAPLMAAEAALRVGAGMVTVLTRAAHRSAILSRRPEIMVVDADDPDQVTPALARATTLIVGPGLGRQDWGEQLLHQALALAKPMVLDADGLNLLAASKQPLRAPAILTPHAGEAATLLGIDAAMVMADRSAAAGALAKLAAAGGSAAVAVLKGAGTLLAHADGSSQRLLGVCGHGNPGMATAGMGDVLAGVTGGLLAQGLSLSAAAMIGVTAHSKAADVAVLRTGERGLLATDLLPELMALLA